MLYENAQNVCVRVRARDVPGVLNWNINQQSLDGCEIRTQNIKIL